METLTLNDDTVLDGHAFADGDTLWVYISNSDLTTVFTLLNDPDKTKKITLSQYGETTVVKGYMHLFCVREETSGMITGGIRKGR